MSRVRENRTHGSTGGDWKRNATASPRQPPTQPTSSARQLTSWQHDGGVRIIDLSPRVSQSGARVPGDEPFSLAWRRSIDSGDAVTVGTVTTTTHIGAHIDAPAHIVGGAASIEATPLDACVGRCADHPT